MNYYYADANNQPIGPISIEQLQALCKGGEITLDTFVIPEGATDWHPYRNIAPVSAPPVDTPTRASTEKAQILRVTPTSTETAKTEVVKTNVRQGAAIGGAVCFGFGIALMYLSMWSFFIYGPLFLASFILSIVAMSQRRILGGLILLLVTLIVPTILGAFLFASRTAKLAEKITSDVKISQTVNSTDSVNEATNPVVRNNLTNQSAETAQSEGLPITRPSVTEGSVAVVKAKHPELDLKMGFRTYKLGTPFSQFTPNDLHAGSFYTKSDTKPYFVTTFDKKLGTAEIDSIELDFLQDILQRVRVTVKGKQSSLALKEVLLAAYGQPDKTETIMGERFIWNGEDCSLVLTSEIINENSSANFTSRSVDREIQAITEQKAKAGAAVGAKNL
jgi:hypothetical protein